MVYTSHNGIMLGILKDALADRDIPYLVKNEYLQGASGQLPAMLCWPELWVLQDEDFTAASWVLKGLNLSANSEQTPDWQCERCGESMEGQFSACWQCGTGRHEPFETQTR
jgi:hypothetical protein